MKHNETLRQQKLPSPLKGQRGLQRRRRRSVVCPSNSQLAAAVAAQQAPQANKGRGRALQSRQVAVGFHFWDQRPHQGQGSSQ